MKISRVLFTAATATGVLALAACGSNPGDNGSGSQASSSSTSSSMPSDSSSSSSTSSSAAAGGGCPSGGTLNAEGSTAQKNAIEQAISNYQDMCQGVTVNYNPTGSGNGIKQFNAGQVDFAGSDSPLKTTAVDGKIEANSAKQRCQGNQALDLPMVGGPIAIAYNVSGVSNLVLDGPTAAKIFQGTIKTWNDSAIKALNPSANLPSSNINVFYRSDSSGTTENFTKYLKAAGQGGWAKDGSKTWTGTGAGKQLSSGVANAIKGTSNSIGYVEYSYAQQNKLGTAAVKTGSGSPVTLSSDSASKAIGSAKIVGTGKDLSLKINYNTTTAGAYPIVLVTYEIACSKGLSADKTALVKSFLSYYASTGQQGLDKLGYAPLPSEIQSKVQAAINGIS